MDPAGAERIRDFFGSEAERYARIALADRLLYRLYDADGALLYIGQSISPDERVRCHRRKPWGSRIHSMTTEGPYSGREAAERAESQAIHTEKPAFALSRQQVGQLAAAARWHGTAHP